MCAFACSRGYCPDSCNDPDADDEPRFPDWLDPSMIEDGDWITDDSGVFCDFSSKPGSLDELLGLLDPNKISPICWNVFASDIQQDMLDQALDDYQSVLDGYDSVFGYYVDWVKDSITPALRKYMDLDGGPGNAYFSCDWTWGTRKGSGACPPSEQFWKSTQELQAWSVTYTLVDSNGFYDAILQDLGIDEKWVKFGDDTDEYACADQGDTPVHGGTSPPCRRVYHKYYSIPIHGDSVTVSNPKDMVQAAMPNITALQTTLLATQVNLVAQSSLADSGDVITAAAMPILMLQGAVSSMASIKDIGEKAADAKKKEKHLAHFGITATTISRVALLISELGNAAISIVDIVDNPLTAPLAILGTLVGARGFSGGERSAYKGAADARRSLSSTDLLKFSDDFRAKDEAVQKIVEACIRY
ncbi:hypothetical protein diail_11657 [Diaporthe ilicicola]|nr:hypothetical protein diail_11657 [Diaporthe ilicicola]